MNDILKRSRRGQGQIGMGVYITVFLAVIVGLILMTASAGLIGKSTTTFQQDNISFTAPANATATTIATEIKEVNNVVIYNYTNGSGGALGQSLLVEGTDFKITNHVVDNGFEVAQIEVFNDDASSSSGARWNMTYEAVPDTYISSGGGRAIAELIIVFFALAIGVIALSPTLRSRILDSI